MKAMAKPEEIREHALICKLRAGEAVGFAELRDAWLPMFPLLGRLEDTPQDPEWHAEGDVAVHTAMVLEKVQEALDDEMSADDRVVFVLAALFHDIAKPITTREAEVRGKRRVVSPRHAEKGRNYLALLLPQLGLSPELQDRVLSLVGYHHHPRKLVLNESSRGAYAQLARMVDFSAVEMLEIADLKGRICPDLDEQLMQLNLFRLQAEEFELESLSETTWLEVMDNMFSDRDEAFVRHAAAQGRMDLEAGKIRCVEEAVARAYQLKPQAPLLTILAGPSGSGKSTWVEASGDGANVVSLDRLREKIAGKRSNQSKNGQVMQAAKEALKVELRASNSVIWDATNTRRDGRGWVAKLGLDYGAYVRIVTFRNSTDTLDSRNRQREHPIPTAALEKQIQGFEWPTLDEAHEVVVV